MAGGRPTKYKEEYNRIVENLCLLGATNKEIATALGVGLATVEGWIASNDEFSSALKKGRVMADANVGKSLYQRAVGYQHPETKFFQHEGKVIEVETIKHYPPDTAAAFIWLKNRRPQNWKQQPEVVKHEHTVKTLAVVKASDYQAEMQVEKKAS